MHVRSIPGLVAALALAVPAAAFAQPYEGSTVGEVVVQAPTVSGGEIRTRVIDFRACMAEAVDRAVYDSGEPLLIALYALGD